LKNKSKNLEILTILFLTSGDGKLPKSLHFLSFEIFIFCQEKKKVLIQNLAEAWLDLGFKAQSHQGIGLLLLHASHYPAFNFLTK
jgi:hypothetical protein